MTKAKDTLNYYNEIKWELSLETSELENEKNKVFGLSKDQKQIFIDMLKGGLEKDQINQIYKKIYGTKLQNRKELTQKFKEENKDLIEKYQEFYAQKKLDEQTFQKGLEEFRKGNPDIDEEALRELFMGKTQNSEQKENFNESIYAERASHKHEKISDDDFESLKPLSARYSYTMQGDVKMHQFDQKSFYIPDYDKVDLRYEDMDYNEKGERGKWNKRSFENLKNSPKMQKLAKENGLDLSTINFEKSLNTFLYLGKTVADAYSMGITFNINFIEKNKDELKRILYGIYTITGQTMIMPYKIDEEGLVSSCDVYQDRACKNHISMFVIFSTYLSLLISCRS
ncbi:MAG TPA: hypothetical protein VJ892_01710 [Candidatus Absconditabacterales bacterium]|nr:hypothetical protein [Candidatus Absconditabacterales bacterium]